jgi:hypothetical protein
MSTVLGQQPRAPVLESGQARRGGGHVRAGTDREGESARRRAPVDAGHSQQPQDLIQGAGQARRGGGYVPVEVEKD